eukprot:1658541-Prorocentrum_lima.AAC.1
MVPAQTGVQKQYHATLEKLECQEIDRLWDTGGKDLCACKDADGRTIPPPVARGVVRMLREVQGIVNITD